MKQHYKNVRIRAETHAKLTKACNVSEVLALKNGLPRSVVTMDSLIENMCDRFIAAAAEKGVEVVSLPE